MKKISVVVFILAIVFAVLIGALTIQPEANILITDYQLIASAFSPVNLPMGDFAWQTPKDILFMSTDWTNGMLPQDVVSFSTNDMKSHWTITLENPPFQALDFGCATPSDSRCMYLIGTSNEKGSGLLEGLAGESGEILWQRALESSVVALAEFKNAALVYSGSTVLSIDPQNGEILKEELVLENGNSSSKWRTITVYQHNEQTYMAVSSGRDIFNYLAIEEGWSLLWKFRTSKTVLELHAVNWTTNEAPHLIALTHSAAYDIAPNGDTQWRVDNNDLNRNMQILDCNATGNRIVFGNILSGIYIANQEGVITSRELPGGAFRLGLIPLPIPANPNFGVVVGNLIGNENDEIVARSSDKVFVFDCDVTLLAQYTLNSENQNNLLTQVRGTPRYQPFIVDGQIYFPVKDQIVTLTLQPQTP